MKPKKILSLLFGYSLALTVTAQPGALDVEFGVDGIVSKVFEPPFVKWYEGHTVLEKPDGKILAGGISGDGGVIARFNPDGSVDTLSMNYYGFFVEGGALVFAGGTFGGTLGVHMKDAAIYDIALQPDGKMVLVGKVVVTAGLGDDRERYIIFRQNADGSHDPMFGEDGFGLALGKVDYVSGHSVAIQPDGKIVVAGKSNYATFLARHHSDGQIDSSFATNGYVWSSFGGVLIANTMLLQPDGKIVVGGTGSFSFSLARFNTDGSLDSGFGTDGIAIADITNSPDVIFSMEQLPNGKILAIGKGGDSLAVARFTNGILDLSYGENGVSFIHLPGKRLVGTSSVLQSDGKLLVAGYAGPQGGDTDDFLLVRLTPEGDLDDSFGNGGIVLTDVSPKFDRLYAISMQQDGKILVTGFASKAYSSSWWGTEFIVARYLSGLETGVDDNSILKNKILVYPNPAFDFVSFQLQGQRPVGSGGVFHIVNAGGRLMKAIESDRPDGIFTVPVRDWSAGVYFLQYVEEGVVRVSERWVKL